MRLFLVALIFCAASHAASMKGVVMDRVENPVGAATLTLTNISGGTPLSVTTNQAGEYFFFQVPAGRYDLTVSAADYKPYARHSFQFSGEAPLQMEVRLEHEKNSAPSIADLEKEVAAKPDDFAARAKLGRAYYDSSDLKKAELQFLEALKLKPDYPPAKLGVAQLALRGGSPGTALRIAQELLTARSSDGMAAVVAAGAFARVGQLEDSIRVLLKYLSENPTDAELQLEMGFIDLQQKHYPEAENAFRISYAMDPTKLAALSGQAQVLMAVNHGDKAVELLAAESAKKPDDLELRKELAATELRAGQAAKSIKEYESLLDLFKESKKEQGEIYARIGGAYQSQSNSEKAIENYKKALQLVPENSNYLTALAVAFDFAGKPQDAYDCYQQALRLDPQNPMLMNNTAFLIARLDGNLDDALRMVQTARRQMPNRDEVMDTLGYVYLKKGLVDSACQIYQDIIAKVGTNPTYRLHYGLALVKKGDKEEAKKQLEAALQNKPSKDEEAQIQDILKKLAS